MIRKLGKQYYRLKGYYPVRIYDQHFKCDPYHLGFWRIVNRGGFEKVFYEILDDYLKPDSVYCDIGAWIGPTVLYASRICKEVYCLEPDEIAYPYLLQNIQLNKSENIKPFPLALGLEDRRIKMASHGGNLGDSMTSMVNVDHLNGSFEATSITWENWLHENNIPKIDFIKMDIEGGEFEIVPQMKDYLKESKPVLYISTHGLFLPEDEKMEYMEDLITTLNLCYRRCFNENRTPITLDHSVAAESVNQFRSFLLVP